MPEAKKIESYLASSLKTDRLGGIELCGKDDEDGHIDDDGQHHRHTELKRKVVESCIDLVLV